MALRCGRLKRAHMAARAGVCGHGYVWCDEVAKQKELAGNVTRIEGWRNTRSYYSAVQVRASGGIETSLQTHTWAD